MRLRVQKLYEYVKKYVNIIGKLRVSILCLLLVLLCCTIISVYRKDKVTKINNDIIYDQTNLVAISDNSIPMTEISKETVVSDNEIVEEETNKFEGIEYGYLFEDLGSYIEKNNTLLTYVSEPLTEDASQPLVVTFGKQDNNQMFTVSTNNLKFSLYSLDTEIYATIENNISEKVYKVNTTSETDAYWKMLYNDTEDLANTLVDIDYSRIEYVGKVYEDNQEYIKMVAEKEKGEENNSKDLEDIIAIKPSIEITEVEVEEETTIEENTINNLTSIDNFNVLSKPGYFVFYFDKTNKLKKLYVRNDNSITNITLEHIVELDIPENIESQNVELIEEDRLGRLMLSSIFAMVSNTELNELSKDIDVVNVE